MPTLNEVCNYFNTHVDWSRFYAVVDTIGASLNSPKDRFEKSDLLELALEIFSGGKIEYIGKNGADHRLLDIQTDCEMKYDTHCLWTGKYKHPCEAVKLALVNTRGNQAERDSLPEFYAPFLLAVDTRGAAVTTRDALEKHLVKSGDQLQAHVPRNRFLLIDKSLEGAFCRRPPIQDFDYKANKLQFQRDFLSRFMHT